MRVQPQRAFAVVKNNIISPTDIYNHPPTLHSGEYLLEVMIIPLNQKPVPLARSIYCYCGDMIKGKRYKYCSDYCYRHNSKNK